MYFNAPDCFWEVSYLSEFVFDCRLYFGQTTFTSIVLVICPLQAFMIDHVKFLRDSIGLNAAYISKDTVIEDFTECLGRNAINLIRTSPESMLSIKKEIKSLAKKL